VVIKIVHTGRITPSQGVNTLPWAYCSYI